MFFLYVSLPEVQSRFSPTIMCQVFRKKLPYRFSQLFHGSIKWWNVMTPRFKEYLYSRWYLRDLLFPMAKRSEEMIRNPSKGQRTRNNAQQRWLLVFYIYYYYYCLSSPNILFPYRSLQDNPELSINSNLLAAHSSSLSEYQPSFLSLFSVGYLSTKMQIRSQYYVTVNHCLVRFR